MSYVALECSAHNSHSFYTSVDLAGQEATQLQFQEQINITHDHNKIITKGKSSPDQMGDNSGELSACEKDNWSREIVKEEDLYCDIAFTSQPGEDTITSGKIDGEYGSRRAPAKRATPGQAGGEQVKTSVPPKPVSPTLPVTPRTKG